MLKNDSVFLDVDRETKIHYMEAWSRTKKKINFFY